MSQLPAYSHGNIPESSNNQEVLLAKEKIRRVIEGQHADLKRKFDQIRQSLSEKEEKVNQELNEILNTRLNELDMCARNINLLNETYNLNQQKLGTNTLGNVNFKILTTVTASIEEFRKKIDTELNIRILWGSHDIEHSIQNICTLSYKSDPQATHTTVSKSPNIQAANTPHYRCTYCKNYFPSLDQLYSHKCNYPEQMLTFQMTDNQIHETPPHTLKEPFSVQSVHPTVYLPSEGPVIPRATGHTRTDRNNSLDHNSLFLCIQCDNYFSTRHELENHQRERHSIEIITSPYRRNSVHRENILERQQQQQQQQQYAAMSKFWPVREKTSPLQSIQPYPESTASTQLHQQGVQHYDTTTTTTQSPSQGSQLPNNLMNQGIPYPPQPQLQPNLPSPLHYIPPQHQAVMPSPQLLVGMKSPYETVAQPPHTQASHALNLPDPHFSYPTLHRANSPELPFPRNVITEPISPSQNLARIQNNNNLKLPQPKHLPEGDFKTSSSRIRSYSVRLIWYKQVETIGDNVFYFDNYNGCCTLQWDRRSECYTCIVNLEEGDHFGQLSLSDSEIMYTVEKFTLPLIHTGAESAVLILKIIKFK